MRLFTQRDIELRFHDTELHDRCARLGVDVRRDLLLMFKEAVNNAARHSECIAVTIDVAGGGRAAGAVRSRRRRRGSMP